MKRTTRATLQVWTGAGLIVIAAALMRLLGYTVMRMVAFVVTVGVATALIIRSIANSNDDDGT